MKTAILMNALIALLISGCYQQPHAATPAQARVTITASSGASVGFSSNEAGAVAKDGDRIKVAREQKFQIDAEVGADLNVGDLVFIDLYLKTGDGKESSCANAIAKVESVANGRAMFHCDFYITGLPEQDCALKMAALHEGNTERTPLAEIKCRIMAPR